MLTPDTEIVYLCLDNDKAGHAAGERMAELLYQQDVAYERLVPQFKGDFIVMKTGTHPMRMKLQLYFKWGIWFDEPYHTSS